MKKIVLATMMAMAMGGASAQAYVEGAFGMTNLDADCSGTYSCDNDGTGFKLIGGFKLNPNVSLEVGYLNFGEATAEVPYGFSLLNVKVKSTAFYFGGALRGELGSGFGGSARLGLANVDTKVDVAGMGSDSDTSMNVLFGLGLDYAVAKNVKLNAAIDFTKTAEVAGEDAANLRMISIGARFDF